MWCIGSLRGARAPRDVEMLIKVFWRASNGHGEGHLVFFKFQTRFFDLCVFHPEGRNRNEGCSAFLNAPLVCWSVAQVDQADIHVKLHFTPGPVHPHTHHLSSGVLSKFNWEVRHTPFLHYRKDKSSTKKLSCCYDLYLNWQSWRFQSG